MGQDQGRRRRSGVVVATAWLALIKVARQRQNLCPLPVSVRVCGVTPPTKSTLRLLAFAPTSGRPARFLDAKTGWGRFQTQQTVQLAQALGLPELREVVLSRHVLLYAHNDRVVVLLSLRHERQLGHPL